MPYVLKKTARQLPSCVDHAQQARRKATVVVGTRGMPCVPRVGVMRSWEVEPTVLARISDTTWQNTDVEMRKLARRSSSLHTLFHAHQVPGVELVFCSTG